MTTDSNWGDLAPIQVERIKNDISRSVAQGIQSALRDGSVRDAIAEGVTVGLQQAVMDETTFDVLATRTATALRRSATRASGQLVVDGVVALGKRIVLIVSVAVIVYAIGGWAALAKVWQIISTPQA
jgi:hypothetical protein